ncbi:hypothetical protein ALC62_03889, partial [Cyphomyrmex costatus]
NYNINTNETLQLTGVTEDVVNTLGTIQICMMSVPVVFHVVSDGFPIIPQGILINYAKNNITWRGRSFQFKQNESVKIPAHTNSGFVIRIANSEIKTGYLP